MVHKTRRVSLGHEREWAEIRVSKGLMKLGNLGFKPMGAGQPLWGEGQGSSFSVGLVCLSEARRSWAGVEED